MFTKWFKRCLIGGLGLFIAGCLVFGKDVVSYVRSSAKSVQSAVKDAVPIEFELRRARDLLEEILPERLKVLGPHNRLNLLASSLVLRLFGLPSDVVRTSMGGFNGIEHRLELFAEHRHTRFYNDSAATIPHATGGSLVHRILNDWLRQIACQRLHHGNVDELSLASPGAMVQGGHNGECRVGAGNIIAQSGGSIRRRTVGIARHAY